jgi:kynurenine formamidase
MKVQIEDFRDVGRRLSNWGRWGKEDERGTVNFITAECLVRAASLVKEGKIFDLGIPFDAAGPQPGGGRINPVHLMSQTGDTQMFPGGFKYADDYIFMPLQCASQWDALAHVYYDDQIYNGFPAHDVTVVGAARDSIEKMGKGVCGRGVLLDIARLRGVDWLEGGYVITPADLNDAMRAQGVAVGSMAEEPGLGQDCCQWLHERQVAAVCSDNWAIEVLPGENPDAVLQIHMILIRDMGMTLGEILDFEELAEDCSADGVWEFFFSAPPLKVTGGVGSPINPLAIK